MIKFVSKYKIKGVEHYATVQECADYLHTKDVVGLDIETSSLYKAGEIDQSIYQGGLDPYMSRVCMIQVGTPEESYVVDVRDFSKEELEPLISFLHYNKKVVLVGHNLMFEQLHLKHNYGVELCEVFDTMLAELVLYNGFNCKVRLQDLAEKYLKAKVKVDTQDLFGSEFSEDDITIDDEIISKYESSYTPFEIESMVEINKSIRLQFVNIGDKKFTYEQVMYGSDDIVYPYLIRERQLVGHSKFSGGKLFRPVSNFRLQSKFALVAADMQYNGLPFKKEEWLDLYDKNKKKYDYRKAELDKYTLKRFPEYNQLTIWGDSTCVINWSSPKQVISIFNKIGRVVKARSKQTGKEENTIGAKELIRELPNDLKEAYTRDKWHRIVDDDTFVLAYLLVNKSYMNISTYGKDFLQYIHPITGRLHPNYRLMLATGRTATTKPNLLAIPNTHREPFNVTGTDQAMIVNDYASQESRVMSSSCKDPAFLDFFNKGDEWFGSDFHSYTSAKVHKVRFPESDLVIYPKENPKTGEKMPEFTKEMALMRQETKQINFGLIYGLTAHTLGKDLGVSLKVAEDLIDSYFSAFPHLKEFLDEVRKEAVNDGYFIYGDKVQAIYIEPEWDKYMSRKNELESIFFSEEYRNKNLKEREEFKANLYRENPHYGSWWKFIGVLKSRLGNKACNYRIQGVAAMQSKTAMVMLREYCIENNIKDFKLMLLLHDEIASRCLKKNADKYSKMQGDFMKKAAEFYCPNIKFETSGSKGEHWEH